MGNSVGTKQGKLWGTTQKVMSLGFVDADLMEIVKGGHSSVHYHEHKWNRFVVIRGTLIIERKNEDTDVWDFTYLYPGDVTDVPPKQVHRFSAVEDSTVMEFCWVELDPEDIVRSSTGGVS